MANIRLNLDRTVKAWGSSVEGSAATWLAWPWTDIQASIDYGIGCGINLFRIHGDLANQLQGTFTVATYQARLRQFADYLLTKRVMFYPDGGSHFYLTQAGLTPTPSEVAACVANTIQAVNGYGNVIGYDLLNEWEFSPLANPDSYLQPVYNAAKAVTSRACTYSHVLTGGAGDLSTSWAGFTYMDHIDLHLYYPGSTNFTGPASGNPTIPPATFAASFRSLFPAKDILFGEFECGYALSDTIRRSYIAACMDNARASDSLGGVYWSLVTYDVGAIARVNYGDSPDSTLVPFRRGQGTASAPERRYLRMVRASNAVEWNAVPIANWAADRLYRDGVKVYEGSLSRYVDPAGLGGVYAGCAFDGSVEGPRIVLDSRMDEARLVLGGAGGMLGR